MHLEHTHILCDRQPVHEVLPDIRQVVQIRIGCFLCNHRIIVIAILFYDIAQFLQKSGILPLRFPPVLLHTLHGHFGIHIIKSNSILIGNNGYATDIIKSVICPELAAHIAGTADGQQVFTAL